MLKGSIVALITPFQQGKVDYVALEKLIEFQIAQGTKGIVPCGTTGESATLSPKEHQEVVSFTVKVVNKRVPVIAGSGANSTEHAIALARVAKDCGADYHLSVTPYYNKPSQEGLFRHYQAIANTVDLPMVLYNVPGRTGVNLLPETVGRLSKIDTIVGIKEATGDVRQAIEVREQTPASFALLSGDDFVNLPLLAVGSTGTISVTANVFPNECQAVYDAWFSGEIETAKMLHQKLMPAHRLMFLESNPLCVKTMAYLLKLIPSVEFRLPLCELKKENYEKLVDYLATRSK